MICYQMWRIEEMGGGLFYLDKNYWNSFFDLNLLISLKRLLLMYKNNLNYAYFQGLGIGVEGFLTHSGDVEECSMCTVSMFPTSIVINACSLNTIIVLDICLVSSHLQMNQCHRPSLTANKWFTVWSLSCHRHSLFSLQK